MHDRRPRHTDRHVHDHPLVEGSDALVAERLDILVGDQGNQHETAEHQDAHQGAAGDKPRQDHAGKERSQKQPAHAQGRQPDEKRDTDDPCEGGRPGEQVAEDGTIDLDDTAHQPALAFAAQPPLDEDRAQGRHERDSQHRHRHQGERLGEGQRAEHLAIDPTEREDGQKRQQHDHHREEDRPPDRETGGKHQVAYVALHLLLAEVILQMVHDIFGHDN